MAFGDESHGFLDGAVIRQFELDGRDLVLQCWRDLEVHAEEDYGPASIRQHVPDLAEPAGGQVRVAERPRIQVEAEVLQEVYGIIREFRDLLWGVLWLGWAQLSAIMGPGRLVVFIAPTHG